MSDGLKLEIATPDRLVLSERVDEVVLPSICGSMGVLPGHAPLLAKLDVGEISYRIGDRRRFLAVAGGFAEVQRGGVEVLVVAAEPAEEIDVERARRAKERAEALMKTNPSEAEFELALASLKRAVSRLRASERSQA
jgi:F-type H+-transporting ATPase subunit epsilon